LGVVIPSGVGLDLCHLIRDWLRRATLRRNEQDLFGLPKADKSKVAPARRLRQETTMTLNRDIRGSSWPTQENVR
jgi:hypothetical protein